MTARRLRRRYQVTRQDADWEAYRQARNHKSRLIKKTLRDTHQARVREAASSQDEIWKLARWARNRRPKQPFTPPLSKPDDDKEHDHQAKAGMFRAAFFPPPPEVDLSDTANVQASPGRTDEAAEEARHCRFAGGWPSSAKTSNAEGRGRLLTPSSLTWPSPLSAISGEAECVIAVILCYRSGQDRGRRAVRELRLS
jgi:hypothetical protein